MKQFSFKINRNFPLFAFLAMLLMPFSLQAQEHVAPLPSHSGFASKQNGIAQKPTALSLPFFEDFTGYDNAPNPALWRDNKVYISNTMSDNQYSRGMAVFDANNTNTIPYDSLNQFHRVWADSLTSRDIDLSGYAPSDSLWLSFFYERGGNGFLPKPEDSLILFFHNSKNEWVRAWSAGGDTANPFKYILVKVTDTGFFNNQFAFRFVNRATHGISNSMWNLDYIHLDAHRNYQDTLLNDLAFTRNSSNLLNDYSAMPYSQFKTNPARFLSDSLYAFLKNNGSQSPNVNYGLKAKELLTGTNFTGSSGSRAFLPNQERKLSFPTFSFSSFTPPASSDGKVVIQSQYFAGSVYPNEPKANDTIVQTQVFDNYFAYDDGSAEVAYFLHVSPNAPGITAIEYGLYSPDTLRGVAIYFPHTVPPSNNKEFSLIVYKQIAINGGTDQIKYQQDYYLPEFQDTINKFSIYRFDHPVAMDSGVYYIGVMQSAGGFSDSLYMGLDVNRENGNHRYYNVDGIWQPSGIDGALMVRPLVGRALPPAAIAPVSKEPLSNWTIYPNPSNELLYFKSKKETSKNSTYRIIDMRGKVIFSGNLANRSIIHLNNLSSGLYLFQVTDEKGQKSCKKFIRK